MRTLSCACLVAAALVAGTFGLTAAENARLRHVVSVYADDQGAPLSLPEGVACGAKGQVVVADTGNGRLLRFTYAEGKVSGGSAIKVPQLPSPSTVQLNSKGEIYVLDGTSRRIVRLGPGGEFKAVVAFDGAPPPATIVVKDFAIDSADNLYVLDVFSGRVLMLNAEGKFVRALPFPDGAGFVSGLAVDFAGDVLLVDSIKRRMFSAPKDAGAFTPLGADLTGTLVTLPTAMTTSRGVIFVVEGGGNIVGFGRDGSFLARQLSRGWEEGMLNHPAQMSIDEAGAVFIADRDNSRVQVFQLMR